LLHSELNAAIRAVLSLKLKEGPQSPIAIAEPEERRERITPARRMEAGFRLGDPSFEHFERTGSGGLGNVRAAAIAEA
jgi:hypothetical protein